MSELKVVGQRLPRQDSVEKVKGEYEYGMDFKIEGQLHGAILRSPLPHALIKSIDVSMAKAQEGVDVVLTAKDLPSDLLMPGIVTDQPPLARERVRYHGEPIAIIAASTLAIAEDAKALIEVEFEPLPALLDLEAAMEPGAPLVHEDWEAYETAEGLEREGNICCHATMSVGDVEAGFAEADFVFEDEFETESVHQAHVEPRVATGLVLEGEIPTVYTNTQLPFWIRTNVAHILGLEEEEVRIVTTGIGGGFGSKLYPQIEPLVALLSKATNKPVRLVVSLSDELVGGLPRHPTKTWVKTGVKKDGSILARQAKLLLDAGAYTGSAAEIASVGVLVLGGPYRTEHVRIDAYSVLTNRTNFGAYRGPGGPQAVFALESHFDDVARGIGMDPLEFRLKNIAGEGDVVANGQILTDVGLRETVEKTAAAIGWKKPAGPNRGKGLSLGWWTTTLQLSTSMVELNEGGQIVVNVGTPEIGTGAVMGGVPQIVAEAMGVELDDVVVNVRDTSVGLWDWGSQGSRVVSNVGRAARFACLELTQKIKDLAEKILEVRVEQLVLDGGYVFVKDAPDEHISLRELSERDTEGILQSRAESKPEFAKYDESRMTSCFYPAFHYPHFHCHAAEIEVDPGTGMVKVLKYAATHDVGVAVNPTLVEGQIHGGVVQGIGMAMMEEVIYDEEGYRTNINWTDYKVPTLADMPEITAMIVEYESELGPYGGKGLGEAPVLHGPAVLGNALKDATGVRYRSLPITPEKVLRGLKDRAIES
jgi:CO/xanthine dehydrogenase Mo-binding subunit